MDVYLNTDWSTKKEVETPITYKKRSTFVENKLMLGTKVALHAVTETLHTLDQELEGRLMNTECRFSMKNGIFPTKELRRMGFIQGDNRYFLQKSGLEVEIKASEDHGELFWAVEMQSFKFRPLQIGQILTKIVQTVQESVVLQEVI